MKSEVINPFIKGSQDVLSMVCNENASMGKAYIKNSLYSDEVSVSIDINGDLNGSVIYTMDENAACDIASKMMMGMAIESLDDMSKSALCELSNMISGTVATIFSSLGKMIDIKTPEFNDNNNNISYNQLLCVPLNLSSGNKFEINVWLAE